MTVTGVSDVDPSGMLPALRGDLKLVRGPESVLNSGTWIIEDLVRQRFFQLSEEAFQLLTFWHVGNRDSLRGLFQQEHGRPISDEEIDSVVHFLYANALTDCSVGDRYEDFVELADRSQTGVLLGAAHNYLFFKLPLVRPHAFLTATRGVAGVVFSRWMGCLIALLSGIGLYFASRQWEAFVGTFLHFFSLEGMVAYAFALIFVKSLHELGHAYMATKYGVRVGSMGVAFMVMFPVLYTDVSEAWRLHSRRQRVAIDGAGIMVELALAGLATLAWVFLPDGPVRSAAFFIATTSWALSLVVNLNPFMRFDGYHLLADAIGVSNLQNRSFDLARWKLRSLLLGLEMPAPERMSAGLRRFLIGYAWCVWVYRLMLFIGIALIVYAFFFKALGIALMVLELVFFVGRPIAKELGVWWSMRREFRLNRSSLVTCGVAGVALFLLFVPLSHSVSLPAVLSAADEVAIFPPRAGRLAEVRVAEGDKVRRGQVMFVFQSPDLEQRLRVAEKKLALVEARRARAIGDKSELSQFLVLQRERVALRSQRDGLLQELSALAVRAEADGVLSDLDETLHVGRHLPRSAQLAILRNPSVGEGVAFADDASLARFSAGQAGRFVPDRADLSSRAVTVRAVATAGVAALDDEPLLASVYGGPIAVEPDHRDRMRPHKAQYRVDVSLDAQPVEQTVRGVVVLEGRPESAAQIVWRRIMTVLIREMGA